MLSWLLSWKQFYNIEGPMWDLLCMQIDSYLEGGPLMSDEDDAPAPAFSSKPDKYDNIREKQCVMH